MNGKRLSARLLLLVAALLAAAAFLVPDSWPPFAGHVDFTSPFPAANAVAGPRLSIPMVSQYQGLAQDNVNCGPAAVVAIVRYLHPSTAVTSTAAQVRAARDLTGRPEGETYLPDLVRALNAFDVPSALLYAGDGPAGGKDPLSAVRSALERGRPVIVTLGGVTLGRGAAYGDHFVIVTGMDSRTGLVDVVDPDNQPARGADWVPGGIGQWPASLIRAAMGTARETGALGVVAGAERTDTISPPLVLLPAALVFALLSLRVSRRRVRRS
ncbi:MAG: C39 family peptidase [Chloroflexota bacterium]